MAKDPADLKKGGGFPPKTEDKCWTGPAARKTLFSFWVKKDQFFGEKELSALIARQAPAAKPGWTLRWTPFFPVKWPTGVSGLEVVSYAYFEIMDIRNMTGPVKVSPPAYALTVPLSILPARGRLEELSAAAGAKANAERQGVRPLTAEETAAVSKLVHKSWADSSFGLWRVAQKMGPAGLKPDEKELYLFWSGLNGVEAGFAERLHPAFFLFLRAKD